MLTNLLRLKRISPVTFDVERQPDDFVVIDNTVAGGPYNLHLKKPAARVPRGAGKFHTIKKNTTGDVTLHDPYGVHFPRTVAAGGEPDTHVIAAKPTCAGVFNRTEE